MTKGNKYKYYLSYFVTLAALIEVIFWGATYQIFSLLGFFSNQKAGEKFIFLHPDYAWAFLSIFLLLFICLWQMRQRNKLITKYESLKTPSLLFKRVYTQRLFVKYFLIRNVLVFGILALMQPVYGHKTINGKSVGSEVVFAVDLSNSMNTRDIEGKETRLTVAKRAIKQLINKSSVSQVGLVIFAGNAYVQLPLTPDFGVVKMYTDELSTSLLSNQGTNISDALQESSNLFSGNQADKIVVLITDGEDHEGDMQTAYDKVKAKNIKVLVLGIGSEDGGIVLDSEEPDAKYLKNNRGETVISKVDRKMLKEIASNLGGTLKITDESFPNIYKILTEINSPTDSKVVNLEFQVKANRYQWPLSIALLCLLVLFGWEFIPKKKE